MKTGKVIFWDIDKLTRFRVGSHSIMCNRCFAIKGKSSIVWKQGDGIICTNCRKDVLKAKKPIGTRL